MSHKKAWKEFSYIKNDQSRDSQSSLSDSRSMQSYRFSQVRFNKGKIQNQKNSKIFTLTNGGSRIKEFKGDSSFLQESSRIRENFNFENQRKEPLKVSTKNQGNRKLETKMKTFLNEIRKINHEMKLFAENILIEFENMKNELQTNLLHLSDELLRFGNGTSQIQKVHQIFHKGFSDIKKSISILPSTLSKLSNECEQQLKEDQKGVVFQLQSPLLQFQSKGKENQLEEATNETKSRAKMISGFSFIKKQGSQALKDSQNFELPLMSHEKLKNGPSTQRSKHFRATSFEKEATRFTNRKESLTNNNACPNETHQDQIRQFEEINKIDDIIFQMRIILNQSS